MFLHNLEDAMKREASSIAAIRRLLKVKGVKKALALINSMGVTSWELRGSKTGVVMSARRTTSITGYFDGVVAAIEFVMGVGSQSTDGYKLTWESPEYGNGEKLIVMLRLEDYDK